MDELTERKQRILRAVVLEYVQSAEPVGSSLLVERYQFGVGPATVRHELSEMSDRGYLDQPHTSAGRVPSDTGYRYFVNKLAEPSVDPKVQKQVREISKADVDLEAMLLETCRVLSRLTQYVSVAATFPTQATKVHSVEFAGIVRERILMTVVFGNGLVENRILEGRNDLTLGDLHQLSVEVTRAAEKYTTRTLSRAPLPDFSSLNAAVQEIAGNAWKSLRSVARQVSTGKVVSEGTHFLFEQPEFQQDVAALSRIVSALENSSIVHDALDSAKAESPVTIGKENTSEVLHSLSLIVGKFYMGDEEAGAIAVVGPTRMRYSTSIPLVDTAARALTEALTRLTR